MGNAIGISFVLGVGASTGTKDKKYEINLTSSCGYVRAQAIISDIDSHNDILS